MSCLKGESDSKEKKAKFACGKCGALTAKKGHVCKPVKLEGDKKDPEKKKGDKGKKKKK